MPLGDLRTQLLYPSAGHLDSVGVGNCHIDAQQQACSSELLNQGRYIRTSAR